MSKAIFPLLKECMTLAPDGSLVWKHRPLSHFSGSKNPAVNHRIWKAWNLRNAGRPISLYPDACGYLGVRATFEGRRHYIKAHRIIFALSVDRWPAEEIDHINGDKADNRFENLREVGRNENARNIQLKNNNTSGSVGVYWHKASKRWVAQMTVNKSRQIVGYFKIKEEAISASQEARKEAPFSERHGRAA